MAIFLIEIIFHKLMFWLNLSNPKRLNGNVYCTVFAVSRLKLFILIYHMDILTTYLIYLKKYFFLIFLEYWISSKGEKYIYLFIYNFLH